MNHIRFLTNNRSVCEKPLLLGHDFVIIDYNEGESCQDCLALIHAHNARARQYDLLVDLPYVQETPDIEVREFFQGVIISSGIWLIILLLTVYVLGRI